MTGTMSAAVALMAVVVCAAVAGASAITTKSSSSSGPAAALIKTTLQVSSTPPATTAADADQPSFAARYWHQHDDSAIATQPQQPPHKLSAAQQVHILDDIRRHNEQSAEQWWTTAGPTGTTVGGKWPAETAGDQLQELLQINGVTASTDSDESTTATDDHQDSGRRGRQGSVNIGGWTPQTSQFYTNHNGQQQQYWSQFQQQFYPPSTTSVGPPSYQHRQQQQPVNFVTTSPQPVPLHSTGSDVDGHIDADVEAQIRQRLTEVAAAGGVNDSRTPQPYGDGGVRYVQIGGGGTASRNHRVPAQEGNKNTVIKTVVIRQKPSAKPPTATMSTMTTTTTTAATVTAVPVPSWSINDQQQLEQLARQVLPPGVAQYEIIRAGGVDGVDGGDGGGKTGSGDVTAADNAVPIGGVAGTGGKKKPVTFVILEERPDGTVRVRGVEKKRPGADGGDGEAAETGAPADDEQLQRLVDKLNRGELRLPSAGIPVTRSPDAVGSASTTAPDRRPPFYPQPSATQKTTTAVADQRFQQNVFLPTALPTASVVRQQPSPPPQHRSPPPPLTVAANSTVVHSGGDAKPAAANEGPFSGALRRRGYYAMAKYMRQAGIDAVLEDTGPFTMFVPTDKAFRALLVQLGGPDRAEDKFRENPRLLIGLLLHHVVPGAFKAADLKAGDEMTGVSLAGTQLRANLYSRQLYDNRWNDIEVLTVNGARVLDDTVPAALTGPDDGFSSVVDDDPVQQQRKDMVLSSVNDGSGGGSAGDQRIVAIGHAVDRVLFPLPVGDVLATMRADRQRRYSVFLRAVDEYCSSSVRNLLSGSRTVTVFAPVDEAFRGRRGSGDHGGGSVTDGLFRADSRLGKRDRRRAADRFVLSHVVLAGPGDPPMYTAGLRFYQVRDTAYRLPVNGNEYGENDDDDSDGATAASAEDAGGNSAASRPAPDGESPRYYQLTVYKDSGKIRLNGGVAQVLVRNVPATNGVLHGIDAPLV